MANEELPKSEPTTDVIKQSTTVQPVVLRSWPKIILMLPTFFASLVCGIIMLVYGQEAPEQFSGIHVIGLIFLLILAVNLTMVLYDLNLRGFIVVVLLIIALVLFLALLNTWGALWESIGKALSIKVFANGAFYIVFCLILWFNLAIAWVITRFNYWKVEHNEIIIHRGFMQEQERHPTAQARFKLAIDDIVEYGVLGCGKLVFYLGDDESEHVLENIPFVHSKAKQLDVLLGRVAVISHQ